MERRGEMTRPEAAGVAQEIDEQSRVGIHSFNRYLLINTRPEAGSGPGNQQWETIPDRGTTMWESYLGKTRLCSGTEVPMAVRLGEADPEAAVELGPFWRRLPHHIYLCPSKPSANATSTRKPPLITGSQICLPLLGLCHGYHDDC